MCVHAYVYNFKVVCVCVGVRVYMCVCVCVCVCVGRCVHVCLFCLAAGCGVICWGVVLWGLQPHAEMSDPRMHEGAIIDGEGN